MWRKPRPEGLGQRWEGQGCEMWLDLTDQAPLLHSQFIPENIFSGQRTPPLPSQKFLVGRMSKNRAHPAQLSKWRNYFFPVYLHTLQAVATVPDGGETAPTEHFTRLYNCMHTLRSEPWWLCAGFSCDCSVVSFRLQRILLLMPP